MIARVSLNRALLALWCLAAAAGCAKVTDERPTEAAPPAETEALRAPAELDVEPPQPTAAREPDLAAVAAKAGSDTGSIAAPPVMPEPLPSSPDPPRREQPAVAASAATPEPAREAELAAAPVVAAFDGDTLDVAALLTRLRKTKAINLRTKLSVKHESDDLLKRFRAYHAQDGTATLAELRRSYDSLFRKLYSLLEDEDPPLARDIDRSRGAIWAILADPRKFSGSAATTATSREPRA